MEPAPSDAQPWHALPVGVSLKDVVRMPLSEAEVSSIQNYADKYFDAAAAAKNPTQWGVTLGKKRNSSATGIKGEWAACKFLQRTYADLRTFLAFRPWRMADFGDAILIGNKAKIFDFKTRTLPFSVEQLLTDDTYMAEMDQKFADRKKYGYLEAFVFCVNHEATNEVYLVGWILAKDYFKYAQLVKKGNRLPRGGSYFNDCVMVPYRRLRPMAELLSLVHIPVSEQLTVALRDIWNKEGIRGVHAYLRSL